MTCIGTFEDDYPGSKYVLSLFSVMVYIPTCNCRLYFQSKESGSECGVPYGRRFAMKEQNATNYWYVVVE